MKNPSPQIRILVMKSINVEGGFFLWNFSKSVSVGSTFIREMRVMSEVYHDECCSVKFVFSKKATKIDKIFTVDLTHTT